MLKADRFPKNWASSNDLTKPINVSPDGHFLAQPDGKPFFWLADTAWPLFMRLDRNESDHYLQDRARKEFTVIQAVAFGGPWESITDPNRYGDLPLIDGNPATPNPRYFDHIDWVVDRAARYGLRLALLPVWGLAMISCPSWDGQHSIFDVNNAKIYGRWLGARYRDRGVIWVLGGDTTPLWPNNWLNRSLDLNSRIIDPHLIDQQLIDHRPIYDAMAGGIIEGDGGDPCITYHPCGFSFCGAAHARTSLYFHDRNWLTMNMIQSSHFLNPDGFAKRIGADFGWNATYNYEPIAEEYTSSPTRPIVDGETRYEGEPIDLEIQKGCWTAFDSRNAAYHALFAGAAGHTYGNNSVHQFYDPVHKPALEDVESPWQVELHAPGAEQMRYVKALMLSRPYFTRIPDQSVVMGDTGEGISHIGVTRDANGDYAMIYLPLGQIVTVNMPKLSGPRIVGWWYNPRTGATTKMKERFENSIIRTFTPPSSGKESDWILVLDNETMNFRAPGISHV